MIWAKKRFQVLERDWFRCQYCWKNGRDVSLEVDHVIPKSKWWTDEMWNLITCCRECNLWKWNEIVWDIKWLIRMKIKDEETKILKLFFDMWNEYWMWTIDSRNVAFVCWLIKSYFERDTVVWYVEQCLVWKIWRIEKKWEKLSMEDFYRWWDDCTIAIAERWTFVRENDIWELLIRVKEDKHYGGTWLTDDYNERLNWSISETITWLWNPKSLLFKYTLFPNQVEEWEKEKETY